MTNLSGETFNIVELLVSRVLLSDPSEEAAGAYGRGKYDFPYLEL